MDYSLRPGRPADKNYLTSWTKDTFAWGDYVVDAYDRWLTHPQSHVVVAADEADEPIAIARGVLLSPDEAWIQGARVHPDWRRRGIATALGDALLAWATAQGAKVARLVAEKWNDAAHRQVLHGGFRETTMWLRAFHPTSHSGRSRPEATDPDLDSDRLQRVAAAEAGPAYLAWSGGELSRAARNMLAVTWQWRRVHPEDLERAAEHGALLAGPTGWAIAAPRRTSLEVGWLQTTAENAGEHLAALLEVAERDAADALEIMMPAVPWLEQAAADEGFETEALLLYEKPL